VLFIFQQNLTFKWQHQALSLLTSITLLTFWLMEEGDMGICCVAVLMFFWCGDAVNKISIWGVAVISNLTVGDGNGVSLTSLVVMRCSLIFFLRCCGIQVPPPCTPHGSQKAVGPWRLPRITIPRIIVSWIGALNTNK